MASKKTAAKPATTTTETANTSAPTAGEPAEVSAAGAGQPAPNAEATSAPSAPPTVTTSETPPPGGADAQEAGEPIARRLIVSSKVEGFRRAGRAWSKNAETVSADDFTAQQIEALRAEPMLDVTIVADKAE